MWKIKVPLRIYIFLWLLANNKVLTRDNLAKRKHLEDKTCLFCNEAESSKHLFFDCRIAHYMWCVMSNMLGLLVFSDFETMATWWLKGKKHNTVNVISFTVLWALWKKRNNICF
jgi:hypothetical protein